MIRAAVLTISDSGYRGEREDLSGPALRDRLRRLGWTVAVEEMLPDEAGVISARLAQLADWGDVSLILTTGGTGVTIRDVTPEATRAVIEKEIPGLGELMRTRGLEDTPRAALSRALAGTRGKALIVNLPGSPRGAICSLDAIVELVPHILELLGGNTRHESNSQPGASG